MRLLPPPDTTRPRPCPMGATIHMASDPQCELQGPPTRLPRTRRPWLAQKSSTASAQSCTALNWARGARPNTKPQPCRSVPTLARKPSLPMRTASLRAGCSNVNLSSGRVWHRTRALRTYSPRVGPNHACSRGCLSATEPCDSGVHTHLCCRCTPRACLPDADRAHRLEVVSRDALDAAAASCSSARLYVDAAWPAALA